jgi:flagellar basal-body rod protein FlgF
MLRGIYTNAAAMNSLQLKLEVAANNLANANTTGFKKDGVFRKHLVDHDTILRQNASDFKGLEDVDAIHTLHKQGGLTPTGNPLDTAFEGDGFFVVQTPEGMRYTRNGNFQLDQDGILVTGNGYQVQGFNGPMLLQGQSIFIGDDGTVAVDGATIDLLQIVDFPKPYIFNKLGDGLYEAEEGTAIQLNIGQFIVRQGVLEDSNVEVIEEMVALIRTSREYETNQKSITMQDETLSRAVNDVGKVQ